MESKRRDLNDRYLPLRDLAIVLFGLFSGLEIFVWERDP